MATTTPQNIKGRVMGPSLGMERGGNWSPPSMPSAPADGGRGGILPAGMGIGRVGSAMQSPMPGRTTGSAPGVTYGTNFKKGGKVKKACSGGKVKKMAKGGSTASKRADGIAQKGKTKGKFV